MEIEVWVATNRVGSKVTRTINIPDEDFEGMNQEEKENYIDQEAQLVLWEMIEWGWNHA
jgi:hypothetical protein